VRPARAAAKASALAMFAVVALIPLSASGVSADANPANHGHHYGQLKHRPAPPPPPPVVPPVVKPPAVTPPGATPPGPGTTGTHVLLPALQIKIDSPIAGVPGGYPLTRSVTPRPQPGLDSWLVLALVVSVLALWIYVFVRLARSARRWQTNRSAA